MNINVLEEPATPSLLSWRWRQSVSPFHWDLSPNCTKSDSWKHNFNIHLHKNLISYRLTSEGLLMFTCLLENGIFVVSWVKLYKGLCPHIPGSSQTFLISVFLRFAGVSYGRFLALRFGFNMSTCIQNRWRQVGGERFKQWNGWEQLTDASSPVRKQLCTGVV
jgi:hypothetical protein